MVVDTLGLLLVVMLTAAGVQDRDGARPLLERTPSWICWRRRCVRDHERLSEHHEAMVLWSMIILMGRRLTRARSHKLS